MKFIITTLICSCLITTHCIASFNTQQKNTLSNIIKDYFDDNDIQGLSVSVVNKNGTLFQKNLGYLDTEQTKPVTKYSLFKVTNITQILTALMVLDLEQNKKLKLNDSIQQYIPELSASHFKNITIQDLIQHYSGISRDYWGCSFYVINCDQKKFLNFINTEEPIYSIEEQIYNYSNNGYILLGILIERITGQLYESYAQKYLTNTLKLTNSHYKKEQPLVYKKYKESNDIKTDGIFLPSIGLLSSIIDLDKLILLYLNKDERVRKSISPELSKVGIYENDSRLPWRKEKDWFTYYAGSLNSQSIIMFNLKQNIGITIVHNSFSEDYVNSLSTDIIEAIELKNENNTSKINNTILDNYSGAYSSFFGTFFLYKDESNYLSNYNSHKIKLSPNKSYQFDLTFILFSILPIRTQTIKDATIYTSRKQNRDRLILEYKGNDQFVFGEKIPNLTYKYVETIKGEYESIDKKNPINSIRIITENNLLIAHIQSSFFEQFIDTDKLKIPLKQVGEKTFITYGLGIEWDGTFIFNNNQLTFSGLTFIKKY